MPNTDVSTVSIVYMKLVLKSSSCRKDKGFNIGLFCSCRTGRGNPTPRPFQVMLGGLADLLLGGCFRERVEDQLSDLLVGLFVETRGADPERAANVAAHPVAVLRVVLDHGVDGALLTGQDRLHGIKALVDGEPIELVPVVGVLRVLLTVLGLDQVHPVVVSVPNRHPDSSRATLPLGTGTIDDLLDLRAKADEDVLDLLPGKVVDQDSLFCGERIDAPLPHLDLQLMVCKRLDVRLRVPDLAVHLDDRPIGVIVRPLDIYQLYRPLLGYPWRILDMATLSM